MSETISGVDEEPTVPDGKESLDYVSKSRIKTYLQCPRKLYWKYWCEERPPGTIYTERGTEVHETFERFHENLIEHVDQREEVPRTFTELLPERGDWQQWIEMVGEFFRFELRRWVEAHRSMLGEFNHDVEERILKRWTPVEIEAEAWLGEPPDSWVEENGEPGYVAGEPPVGDIPWMGRADLIVDTRSVPGVDGNGVTIIDYKTGTAPTIKYEGKPWLEENLQEGIFLEGEYYGCLFEPHFDIDAVAGYYPANDEFITAPYPDEDRRRDIKRAVLGMQREPEIENFGIHQSGLCHWDNENGEGQCHFHGVCETSDDCSHCGTKGSASKTSGSGRYD